MQQDWITHPGPSLCCNTGVTPLGWYVTSSFNNKSRSSHQYSVCMYELHSPHAHQVNRTNPSISPGLDLCWPPATPPGSIPYMCTPLSSTARCQILTDFVPLKTRSTRDPSIPRSSLTRVTFRLSIATPKRDYIQISPCITKHWTKF